MNKLILVAIVSSLVTLVVAFAGLFIFGYYQNWNLPVVGQRVQTENVNTENTELTKSNDIQQEQKVNEEKTEEVKDTNPYLGWNTYKNTKLGFSFMYPKHFTVKESGDIVTLKSYLTDSKKNYDKVETELLQIRKGNSWVIDSPHTPSNLPKSVNILGKDTNIAYGISGGGSYSGTSSLVSGYAKLGKSLMLTMMISNSSFNEIKMEDCASSGYEPICTENVGKKSYSYTVSDTDITNLVKVVESIKLL